MVSKASADAVLDRLRKKADPDRLAGMARYGMAVDKRLGVTVPDMRRIAKQVGRDHQTALRLWRTGIAEARIVASMTADPEKLTERQMETWVRGFDSWDVCDQVCMNLFDKTPFARDKIIEWAGREEEFVRRAAFALIAVLAVHDKQAPDSEFTGYFGLIKAAATDERNYVRKAVNWALRNIGKRNVKLNKAAVRCAKQIRPIDSKSARWIAADAIRELEGDKVRARLQKK